MEHRYYGNIPAISPDEQAALKAKSVLVLGCGGLGGYIIENLLRMGIGRVTVVDGDSFDETNLNRQLLCAADTLGMNKARAAKLRAGAVNPLVEFRAEENFLDVTNAVEIISGHELVMDALDNVGSRLLMEEVCAGLGIPIIHGAVSGWVLQAALVTPGSGLLHMLYAGSPDIKTTSTLPMTAQLCASLQCAEALKLLCGREPSLENRLLTADLQHMQWEYADF